MLRKLVSIILVHILPFVGIIPPRTSIAQEVREYTIAVFDLEATGISELEARSLTDNMRVQITRLINSSEFRQRSDIHYTVVERSQMDKILGEFEFQNLGCTDISCAVEFGKILSVERIIIGSIGLVGQTYTINTSIVDVETARILDVAEYRFRGEIDGLLNEGIPNIVNELFGIQQSHRNVYLIAGATIAIIAAAAVFLLPSGDKGDDSTIVIDIPVPFKR
ncbi:hypothetical protein ACFL5H_03450 [Candidatus Latescibacterota bacterium]